MIRFEIKWVLCVAAIGAATFFFGGCAGLNRAGSVLPGIQASASADALLKSLRQVNRSLTNFKGIGTITVVYDGAPRQFRAAWVVAEPNLIRIQLLAFTGQPVLSIACDGIHYYFLSHDQGKMIKKRASADSLKRVVDVPIGPAELVALLCARLTGAGATVAVGLAQGTAPDTVLVLQNPEAGTYWRLYLDDQQTGIQRIDGLSDDGEVIWRATYEAMQVVDGYRIPIQMTLDAPQGGRVRFLVDRSWVNSPVFSAMFVLQTP